jgi:ElaB/YqjD/DUF883 family membrane-anchored ribosome-binding protein
MTPQSSGHPSSDRPGNGSAGTSGAGTFPDPVSPSARPGWTRSDETSRSEFGAFLDDLSELARGGGHGTDLRGEIERRVTQARRRTSAALEQGAALSARARARAQVNHGLAVSRDAVAGRPLSSLAIAAVGGLIVGLLMSRRD